MRNICFVPEGWEQYTYWHSQDRKTFKRINALLDAAARDPFAGIGKPEALVGNLSGYWSRRINDEHRLVYTVKAGAVVVIACRFHYSV